ncbi:MAG: lactate utilization protein [Lachnospiraceae bacterium]|nr:lactate utilization protein [Lachnospiraceae bacterium]
MNDVVTVRNEKLVKDVIKGLESRNMKGYYAANKEEALKIALDIIPKKATITMGGSVSVSEIGLRDALTEGDYDFRPRETFKDEHEAAVFGYTADFFLGSTNAMTSDGILVNIDGNSNRVSAYAYGPSKVLLIVGVNKICGDLDSAMKRARNDAATINAQRFGLNTPCSKTGKCADCKSPDTICCQFLTTRYSRHADRYHVIIVNENLGF